MAFGVDLVVRTEAQNRVCWIEPGIAQLRFSFWLTDQMTSKWAAKGLVGKAEILSFKGVVRAGNYPLWISFQKINKIGLVHG